MANDRPPRPGLLHRCADATARSDHYPPGHVADFVLLLPRQRPGRVRWNGHAL